MTAGGSDLCSRSPVALSDTLCNSKLKMNSLTLSLCCFSTPPSAVHQKGEWFSLSSASVIVCLCLMEEWRDGLSAGGPGRRTPDPAVRSRDSPQTLLQRDGWWPVVRHRSAWPSAGCVKVWCLCCSTWPVWRRLALWRINCRLMWGFRKTPQVMIVRVEGL